MPVSIPADIWMYVAEFINNDDLYGMLSVNRTFLQLSMNARYSHVEFFRSSGVPGFRHMRRLRDPFIAHCVRDLHMDLDSLQKIYKRDEGYDDVSTKEIIQATIDTITCFINVTGLFINWNVLPAGAHILALIDVAWKRFGPRLRTIVFWAPWMNFPHLMAMDANIPVDLHHLTVGLEPGPNPKQSDEVETTAKINAIAEFINKVGPTLQSLSLSRGVADQAGLSPLFRLLRKIPNIERLTLDINNGENSICDHLPNGLPPFLRNHGATLRHLIWIGTFPIEQLGYKVRWSDENEQVDRMLNWLSENQLDEVFSNLLTLELPIPRYHHGFAMITSCIWLSASTLTSLRLDNHYLSYEEVEILASLFESQAVHLKELTFEVKVLSPELILLLARTFPFLKKLSLDYEYETVQNEANDGPANAKDERAIIQRIGDALKKHDFRDWTLHDIKIRKCRTFDVDINEKVMRMLAESVPSVQTFYGVDKKIYDACCYL